MTTQRTRFEDPLEALWARMAKPINLRGAVPSYTGIPRERVADLCSFAVALSEETAGFLDEMPKLRRKLPHTTSMRKVRCDGHLRGPILWSETVVAQSHSLASDDVFVCGMSRRDFDVGTNRLIAWHLAQTVTAGRRIDGPAGQLLDQMGRELITDRATTARKFLKDDNLADVERRRLGAAEVRAIRTGPHAADFGPVLRLHERSRTPISPSDLSDLCDDLTRAQLRAFHLLIQALEQRGLAVPQITARNGSLRAGRVGFVHHSFERFHGFAGVVLEDTLILAPSAGGTRPPARRKVFFVEDFDDAVLAVEMVLGAAPRRVADTVNR